MVSPKSAGQRKNSRRCRSILMKCLTNATAVSSFNFYSLHTDLNHPNPLTEQAGKEWDRPYELTGCLLALLRPENLVAVCANQATD